MEWYYWALIVIGFVVLLWIKSKYIWPKLFSKKNENMMIKLQKKVYPGI